MRTRREECKYEKRRQNRSGKKKSDKRRIGFFLFSLIKFALVSWFYFVSFIVYEWLDTSRWCCALRLKWRAMTREIFIIFKLNHVNIMFPSRCHRSNDDDNRQDWLWWQQCYHWGRYNTAFNELWKRGEYYIFILKHREWMMSLRIPSNSQSNTGCSIFQNAIRRIEFFSKKNIKEIPMENTKSERMDENHSILFDMKYYIDFCGKFVGKNYKIKTRRQRILHGGKRWMLMMANR